MQPTEVTFSCFRSVLFAIRVGKCYWTDCTFFKANFQEHKENLKESNSIWPSVKQNHWWTVFGYDVEMSTEVNSCVSLSKENSIKWRSHSIYISRHNESIDIDNPISISSSMRLIATGGVGGKLRPSPPLTINLTTFTFLKSASWLQFLPNRSRS